MDYKDYNFYSAEKYADGEMPLLKDQIEGYSYKEGDKGVWSDPWVIVALLSIIIAIISLLFYVMKKK